MCVRGERMCTCVLGMLILPVSMIFQLDSDSVVFSN
jgi:hypothetical protein